LMAPDNPPSMLPEDLDALIEGARIGEGVYTFGGNALHGWWTGRSRRGEQLLAAPYGEVVFLARFDDAGNLMAVERYTYPAEGRARPLPNDCINVADLEARLRRVVPGFQAGKIRVKPFRIEEIEFELHPLPDWVRDQVSCGMRAADICRYPGEWKALRDWFERGYCDVYFHSDGCWYDGSGEADG
jgi:hypothetical protein